MSRRSSQPSLENGAAFLKDLCYRETLEGFENLAGKANTNEVPVTIYINALFEPTYFEGPTKDVNLENASETVLHQSDIYIHSKQKD